MFFCKIWKLFFLVDLLGCCIFLCDKLGGVMREIFCGCGLEDLLMFLFFVCFYLLYSVFDVRFFRDFENVWSFMLLIFLFWILLWEFSLVVVLFVGEFVFFNILWIMRLDFSENIWKGK